MNLYASNREIWEQGCGWVALSKKVVTTSTGKGRGSHWGLTVGWREVILFSNLYSTVGLSYLEGGQSFSSDGP